MGRLRPYAALGQRKHPLAVPPASRRNRSRAQVAGDGRSAKGGQLRKVELLSLTTKDAIAILNESGKYTNAILHVTY